ncbi:hypothetical protein PHET_09096 [Paragonimus heterotremus]|uniref:Uncharacterized protein n=1 Tax=Paragonimus heterotremus TaxID=100268 RepID=A0A8J4WUD6_9TREM|nr:hypothetical protein PHET_09096 [Paragonimus heterotremus]
MFARVLDMFFLVCSCVITIFILSLVIRILISMVPHIHRWIETIWTSD